jgi:hypothetical protein
MGIWQSEMCLRVLAALSAAMPLPKEREDAKVDDLISGIFRDFQIEMSEHAGRYHELRSI